MRCLYVRGFVGSSACEGNYVIDGRRPRIWHLCRHIYGITAYLAHEAVALENRIPIYWGNKCIPYTSATALAFFCPTSSHPVFRDRFRCVRRAHPVSLDSSDASADAAHVSLFRPGLSIVPAAKPSRFYSARTVQ